MLDRKTKLRWRRLLRRRQRQVEGIGQATDQHLERHFFRRLSKLIEVRRFVFGWVTLVIIMGVAVLVQANSLRGAYQTFGPIDGGTLNEGVVGKYSNASPLYATGAVDSAVSKLIFAGLFKYDQNNNLQPSLAEKYEIDTSETKYTVTLKPDLVWHDGEKLTSEDVVFTYQMIQNPDARSFLQASWRGITIEAPDDRTVVFTLPSALSAFPQSLTTGIVPKHILESTPPEQLRSSDFNAIKPVGAGPFKFDAVEIEKISSDQRRQRIGLVANEDYEAGKPKLDGYVIHTYDDQKELEQAYLDKKISAMAGLANLPDSLERSLDTVEFSLPVAGQTMVFFKTTKPPLTDSAVRQALVLGSDRQQIINSTGLALVPSDSPLLRSHLGYDKKLIQKTSNPDEARKILDKAGWKVDQSSGIRKKANKELKFKLYSEANSEYASVTQSLQKQWRDIGANIEVILQSSDDLQSTVSSHNYSALLYPISTGIDPDVYAYWHSSQGDIRSSSRLNFSEYKSPQVDNALEAGRSRSDPAVRAVKYQPFLKSWLADNPALTLYQPRYLFVAREPFHNFQNKALVSPADRYNGVENWMIREGMR
jgi:peptide/nickel transport system substrate-binding protein